MSLRNLPPAGNTIAVRDRGGELPVFPGYASFWVNSGTAALALALALARRRHPGIDSPEVILPAYGCPDLVAAAEFAGVTPILSDVSPDDPGYRLDALAKVLSARTVAVVAVNFLGIRDRLAALRELLKAWPAVALVEDDAQWFPEPLSAPGLEGDFVCLSFGRGKPVSLLGGGALLIREEWVSRFPVLEFVAAAPNPGRLFGGKLRAYNLLLAPLLYGLVGRNPLLRIGRTTFKPLQQICALDEQRRNLLEANVAQYLALPGIAATRLSKLLPAQFDLPRQLPERCGRLLRYPVLCADADQRTRLWRLLHDAGLGVTALYERYLPAIEGVSGRVETPHALPGAEAFAARLLTLPVHDRVALRDTDRIVEIIARVAGGRTG